MQTNFFVKHVNQILEDTFQAKYSKFLKLINNPQMACCDSTAKTISNIVIKPDFLFQLHAAHISDV